MKEPGLLTVIVSPTNDISGMIYSGDSYSECDQVIYVSSGEEAIQVCMERSDIGLVILPPDLRGINGFETVSKLRETQPSLPVIMLSSRITLSALRLATHVGCNEIMEVPLHIDELSALCRKYLKKNENAVIT